MQRSLHDSPASDSRDRDATWPHGATTTTDGLPWPALACPTCSCYSTQALRYLGLRSGERRPGSAMGLSTSCFLRSSVRGESSCGPHLRAAGLTVSRSAVKTSGAPRAADPDGVLSFVLSPPLCPSCPVGLTLLGCLLALTRLTLALALALAWRRPCLRLMASGGGTGRSIRCTRLHCTRMMMPSKLLLVDPGGFPQMH
jgi:hypothetical protein